MCDCLFSCCDTVFPASEKSASRPRDCTVAYGTAVAPTRQILSQYIQYSIIVMIVISTIIVIIIIIIVIIII